mgnify:CR=1 FL=1
MKKIVFVMCLLVGLIIGFRSFAQEIIIHDDEVTICDCADGICICF